MSCSYMICALFALLLEKSPLHVSNWSWSAPMVSYPGRDQLQTVAIETRTIKNWIAYRPMHGRKTTAFLRPIKNRDWRWDPHIVGRCNPNSHHIPELSCMCSIQDRTGDHPGTQIPLCPLYTKGLQVGSCHEQWKSINTETIQIYKRATHWSELLHCFSSVEKPNTRFRIDSDGVSVWVPPLNGASHRVVPVTLRSHFPHLCHYSLLTGHLGEHRMYDFMRK